MYWGTIACIQTQTRGAYISHTVAGPTDKWLIPGFAWVYCSSHLNMHAPWWFKRRGWAWGCIFHAHRHSPEAPTSASRGLRLSQDSVTDGWPRAVFECAAHRVPNFTYCNDKYRLKTNSKKKVTGIYFAKFNLAFILLSCEKWRREQRPQSIGLHNSLYKTRPISNYAALFQLRGSIKLTHRTLCHDIFLSGWPDFLKISHVSIHGASSPIDWDEFCEAEFSTMASQSKHSVNYKTPNLYKCNTQQHW